MNGTGGTGVAALSGRWLDDIIRSSQWVAGTTGCSESATLEPLLPIEIRVQRLQRLVVPASADNQTLSLKSLQAGQIGLLDQLIVNRQALDAERDLNDVLAEMHATQIELETAAGWPMEGNTQ
jgi:hypothetical protein